MLADREPAAVGDAVPGTFWHVQVPAELDLAERARLQQVGVGQARAMPAPLQALCLERFSVKRPAGKRKAMGVPRPKKKRAPPRPILLPTAAGGIASLPGSGVIVAPGGLYGAPSGDIEAYFESTVVEGGSRPSPRSTTWIFRGATTRRREHRRKRVLASLGAFRPP